MKQLGSLLVVAFGTALITFACAGDEEPGDDSGGESGNGGSSAGTSGKGGQNNGGTTGGRGGTAGRAGSGGGGRGGTGGPGGSPVDCSSANHVNDIDGKACDDEIATCDVGEECCCGECSPSLSCSCNDGRWSCYYTDFCAFTESCGGAGGQGGQAGQGT